LRTDVLREIGVVIVTVLCCERHWCFPACGEAIIRNEKTENARKMTEMAQRWGLASQGPRSAIVCAIHQLLADVENRPHLSIGLSACDAIDPVIYV
jgi:hypothetical protein